MSNIIYTQTHWLDDIWRRDEEQLCDSPKHILFSSSVKVTTV